MKGLRYGILAALLIMAGVMAYQQNLPQENRPLATPTPAPTASAKEERSAREAAYDKDVETLRELAQTDEEAARQLKALVDLHQSELAIEEALWESGIEDALVIVYHGSVTVMTDDLTEENSAKILALSMAHADVEAQNVRIMAR